MKTQSHFETPHDTSAPPGKPDLRVAIVLIEQFTLTPVAGFVDSLRFAADRSFDSRQIYCQWDWLSVTGEAVTASCGLPIAPTRPLDPDERYDYVVLAGGLLSGVMNPAPELLGYIHRLVERKVPIIALCASYFTLGLAGVLKGRRCAVHFTVRDEFAALFPDTRIVVDKAYVEDTGIFTCPGGTAFELAAEIISRHCGKRRAQKGLEYLLVNDEEVQRNTDTAVAHVYQDPLVQRAIDYMRSHLDSHCTLKQLAASLGCSERQLHRAFLVNTDQPPAQYWRQLRLQQARKLLSDTSLHVTQIAYATGFADASHFIQQFRKCYGETPHLFRKFRHEAERLIRP
ncbi:GlxA family transcriptional regulator [Pseudomonas sp. BJa5]|uniref:GlxA family transcriptional regulator n=1 Tax=Pseudomonas sp. BJa5 TaxID=2936270 RepID=UPI00255A0F7B|nr:helix-turn-helix domain-containing protein [Pseudomonas sp. BGr12]MDL2422884.1 helix-turn-helix domain-containing protein [Pseudomonas sp. BGr12]